jgi:hypothetical protein
MKRASNIIILFFVFFGIIAFESCTKNFEKNNTNPTLISEELVTPDMLLTHVETNVGNGLYFQYAEMYSGLTSRNDGGPFTDFFYDAPWNQTYTVLTNNLAAIIRKTSSDPDLVNKYAIARILRAWIFSQCTDTYGDIPYSEANQAPSEAIVSPKYDSQESIYQDLLKELKEAASQLDASKVSYGNADLIYNGDVGKWKKLANSLRLRLALRVRYAAPELAKNSLSDLQVSDLITGTSEQALFFTSDDMPSHWNGDYTSLINFGVDPASKLNMVGKTVLDILINGKAHDPIDPRTKIIADTAYAKWPPTLNPPIPYFGYRGTPLFGTIQIENRYPYGSESTSTRSDFWYVPVIERPILRASEVYFALAEAALFNLLPGDPNEYYKKGLEVSISELQLLYNRTKGQLSKVEAIIRPAWTQNDIENYVNHKEITQTEINNFLSSSTATLTGSGEEKLEQIINQKSVGLFFNGQEAWSEWRRTGYPRVLVGDDGGSTLKGVSYRRGHYPASEALVNSVNYKEALNRMGGKDDVLSRVWWDANPDAPRKHMGTLEYRATPWQ